MAVTAAVQPSVLLLICTLAGSQMGGLAFKLPCHASVAHIVNSKLGGHGPCPLQGLGKVSLGKANFIATWL